MNAFHSGPEISWHSVSVSEARGLLHVTDQPLSQQEAERRRGLFGPNALPPRRRRGPFLRLLRQFQSLLIYIMMVAAGLMGYLGDWIDAGVLFAAVVVNVLIGFIQEGRAESALEALQAMLPMQATVIRAEGKHTIPAADLVPGDRIVISAGDRIPADIRLTTVKDLRVDESPLTGESSPVEKDLRISAVTTPLSERTNMAFSGTFAHHGWAEGLVVETGARSELGKINAMLATIPDMATPLVRQINRFGRFLAAFICGSAALVFVFGIVWRHLPVTEMFTLVVALAASAIPEGLPAIITITLALGVQRMAKRHAIVRRLPAVESLGSVTTICTDKTGTLTQNEMTVQHIVTSERLYQVSGSGYAPIGSIVAGHGAAVLEEHPVLYRLLEAAILCNEASLHNKQGQWVIHGDPTEASLLVAAAKGGLSESEIRSAWTQLDLLPFDSAARIMAIHARSPKGEEWLIAKGAPERILELCSDELKSTGTRPLNVGFWHQATAKEAAQGLRLLAIACKQATPSEACLSPSVLPSALTLMGLVSIMDPPRTEAILAIQQCQAAGISVKMFTGDHLETAQAIGRLFGLSSGEGAIEGASLAHADLGSLAKVAARHAIFARVSPEDKLRLVQALRSSGEVVAMTGDGVNDAPALKQADVGVAMGLKGTEVARQAADIILADDHFATIAAAVREGRAVYDNIKKFILFMLPTNGGEALVVIASVVLNTALALTPAQILWVNMVTSSTLGLALAFEPAEADVMQRAPRPPQESLLSRFFVWRLLFVSLLMTVAALSVFLFEVSRGTNLNVARTMCVNTIVISEIFYLFCSRSFFGSAFSRNVITANPVLIVSVVACAGFQVLFSEASWMHLVFESEPLTAGQWLLTIAAASFVLVGSETEKTIVRLARGLSKTP